MWIVHKFGGASLADAACFRTVKSIVEAEALKKTVNFRHMVVVSAVMGVTDSLVALVNTAKNKGDYMASLDQIVAKHFAIISQLGFGETEKSELEKKIQEDVKDVRDILRGVYLMGCYSQTGLEVVCGYGELWSAQILDSFMRLQNKSVSWLDSRKVLFVQEKSPVIAQAQVVVEMEISKDNLRQWLEAEDKSKSTPQIIVVTGFIASYRSGIATTLGRNGSDYSASLFGALLTAERIIIWKDVDGVYSADPKKVPSARVLYSLSYNEAMELAYFGAKILHPRTMEPAVKAKIPIEIKNTFHPDRSGTMITEKSTFDGNAIKGISSINNIALLNVEGPGMAGVPGVAQKLFGALNAVNISVIMISQASSEHSICFAILQNSAELAKETIEKEFFREIHLGLIAEVDVIRDCTILAAVGDGMRHTAGVSAGLFTALKSAKVNVIAIAQGSCERNISIVMKEHDSTRALLAVHENMNQSLHVKNSSTDVQSVSTYNKIIFIGVIGVGVVGAALIQQLQDNLDRLSQQHNVKFVIVGLLNSKKMILTKQGLPITSLTQAKDHIIGSSSSPSSSSPSSFASSPSDASIFLQTLSSAASEERSRLAVTSSSSVEAILVDCTSDLETARKYPQLMQQGVNVVTPNKKGLSSELSLWQQIESINRRGHDQSAPHHPSAQASVPLGRCLFRTTVGAALPILTTLREMVMTGDDVISIEGVLSGTLSFLFNSFCENSEGPSFSHFVSLAKTAGYTEPDPRDDLSGVDVARKLTILCRTAGQAINMESIKIESLVPAELSGSDVTVAQFMERFPSLVDTKLHQKRLSAADSGNILRYVGVLSISRKSPGDTSPQVEAKVELREYSKTHSFASLSGADNIVLIRTRRFDARPMIIRGPGAGADVTAFGVFADLLKLSL